MIQCLHLMYAEVAWVLVSLGTHVQLQVILDPDYLPDYLSVSYGYGQNLKHEIEFIIKSNEYWAENKVKNETEQLFLKYKHGNDIHEYSQQQHQWTT